MAMASQWSSLMPSASDASKFQVLDSKQTQQFDPTAAPEQQAKVALDAAISAGNVPEVQVILKEVGQQVPNKSIVFMMHGLRTAGKLDNTAMMLFLLDQIGSCHPQQVKELMKYALDGASQQDIPNMIGFLMAAVAKVFQAAHPQQFIELVQYSINVVAKNGNLVLLKFLMDHTAAAAITVNYDEVFGQAIAGGSAETLLKGAIQGGAQYENVILMLLQAVKNLPENNDSRLGSRQSLKNTAKFHAVKCYKRENPELFARFMSAVKSFFPEETADGDSVM